MAVTSGPAPAHAQAPFWLTWVFAGALVSIFLGERVLGHLDTAHLVFTWGGALVALAATVWRLVSFLGARGDRRRVERLLLLGHFGCLVGLAAYVASTGTGMRWLGLGLTDLKARGRYQDLMTIVWLAIIVISLLPLILAQAAHGAARHARDGAPTVEAYRVGEAAAAGLTIAFASIALYLLAYVAAERDHKVDLSYFRTAMPGTATKNMVTSLNVPLRVLLFFPEPNEVKDEVESYFKELEATGHVTIESHDKTLEPKLARDYQVNTDGTIVIVKGEQNERIALDTKIERARTRLRTLDQEVQKAFMKVARRARVAYLTVGHGELNAPGPDETPESGGLTGASVVRQLLEALNYRVKDLGIAQGLANDVPDDAALVLMLGPKQALLDAEQAALERYLDRGGALLLALDPRGDSSLRLLGSKLGLKFDPTPLADDKVYVVVNHAPSDRSNIATAQFSAHASITTLGRSRTGSPLLLFEAGSLSDAPDAPKGADGPKRTYVVRSLTSTFQDGNGNHTFDAGAEKRTSYNLAAAVEGKTPPVSPTPDQADASESTAPDGSPPPSPAKAQAESPPPMRAFVVTDAALFSDFLLNPRGVDPRANLNLWLALDGLKWLGGEETFAGETTSEQDVPIQHTRSKDVAWFYSTIVGAPLLVLTLGLAGVYRRRRRHAAPAQGRRAA